MSLSERIKKIVLASGADLFGVAPAERFARAPRGFHPSDIFSQCLSVAVFAKTLPAGAFSAGSCIPYTFMNIEITREVDRMTLQICSALEKKGLTVVPIPSDDPYEHWEAARSYGRAILSLRHAGHLAGLGVLGKNTLLINDSYGNLIQLGAILISEKLDGSPIAKYSGCPDKCRLCLDACPAGALDGKTVNQQLCRPLSNYRHEKGYILKKCYRCRMVCPHAAGIK